MNRLSFVVLILIGISQGFAQAPSAKVLIILPDSAQFYSNAFYLKDLSYLLDTKPEAVFDPYLRSLERELMPYEYERFEYISCSKADLKRLHASSDYKTILDKDGEEYLGVVPVDGNTSTVQGLMNTYGAAFILFVNLYEILSDDLIKYYGENVEHVIHYDLFSADLKLINGGKFSVITGEFFPEAMEWFYKDFALNTLFWCSAWRKDSINLSEGYIEVVNAYEDKKFGFKKKKGVGFHIGTGMPYGGIGIEFNYNINHFWDLNIGGGRDFCGFKVGLGVKHYALGFKKKVKPFVGFNYAYASGNQYMMGAQRDQYGAIINPDNVSRYKIFSDHAIYLRGGLNILSKSGIYIAPTIGYSYAFRRLTPELLEGNENEIRDRLVKFLAVGGLDIGIAFYYYW